MYAAADLLRHVLVPVRPALEDENTLSRIRSAGSMVGRGFFSDFDAEGTRDMQPRETIQFLVADRDRSSGDGVGAARHAIQVSASYRPRLVEFEYHNPDGYQRSGEYDFVTYFECTDNHLAAFDRVCAALRDERQNPEWHYVREGPEWRGYRVLRW